MWVEFNAQTFSLSKHNIAQHSLETFHFYFQFSIQIESAQLFSGDKDLSQYL